MSKLFRFRLLSLLILVSVIGITLGTYLAFYQPGNISIRTSSGEVLIDHDDIQFVDWDTQRYHLRPGLENELSERFHQEGGLIGGVPFQFCIDDDPIFTGRFTSPFSSLSFPDIAILLQPPGSQSDAVIELDWEYASSPPPERKLDPRFPHRLYTSLWLDGKLDPANRE